MIAGVLYALLTKAVHVCAAARARAVQRRRQQGAGALQEPLLPGRDPGV